MHLNNASINEETNQDFAFTCFDSKHCCLLKPYVRKAIEAHKFTITPNPLKRNGNTVEFTITAKLPKNLLPANTQYIFDIIYVSGDEAKFVANSYSSQELKIGQFKFEGSTYQHSLTDPTQTKTMRFSCQEQHKQGYLAYHTFIRSGRSMRRTGPHLITNDKKPVIVK